MKLRDSFNTHAPTPTPTLKSFTRARLLSCDKVCASTLESLEKVRPSHQGKHKRMQLRHSLASVSPHLLLFLPPSSPSLFLLPVHSLSSSSSILLLPCLPLPSPCPFPFPSLPLTLTLLSLLLLFCLHFSDYPLEFLSEIQANFTKATRSRCLREVLDFPEWSQLCRLTETLVAGGYLPGSLNSFSWQSSSKTLKKSLAFQRSGSAHILYCSKLGNLPPSLSSHPKADCITLDRAEKSGAGRPGFLCP